MKKLYYGIDNLSINYYDKLNWLSEEYRARETYLLINIQAFHAVPPLLEVVRLLQSYIFTYRCKSRYVVELFVRKNSKMYMTLAKRGLGVPATSLPFTPA